MEEHVVKDAQNDFVTKPLQTRLPYGIDALEGSIAWGDMIQEFKDDPNNFRLLTQNVNTMNEHHEWEQWVALGHAAKELGVGALALQETNIDWTKELTYGANRALRHNTFKAAHLSTSTSAEPATLTNHKRGGTACALFGKWTGRLHSHGSDTSGLGRWSHYTMHGRQGRKITVVSAYRPCQESLSQSGITSAYAQQHRLLNLRGESNPNPRQRFLDDLQSQVRQWTAQNHEVILSLDSNEDLRDRNSKLANLLAETDLVHLLGNRHHLDTPATHTTKTIDYVFCTPGAASAVTACGYLPFQHHAEIKGDHRGIFVDFNANVLFGVSTPELLDLSRGVYSDRPLLVSKFGPPVVEECVREDLLYRTQTLMDISPADWSPEDHGKTLDNIDKIFHDALLRADRLCHRLSKCPWTPAIHAAYLVRRYWELRVTARKRQRNLSHVLEPLESILGADRFLQNPLRSDTGQLRVAKQELHRLRVDARKLREEFLTKQLDEAIQADEQKRIKALRNIKKSEAKRRVWNMTKRHVKQGQQTGGGLSYIRVPVDPTANVNDPSTQWREVHDPEEMEQYLLSHTQKHFAQAEGTPSTLEPLRSLLDYDGLSDFAKDILTSRADLRALDTDEFTKLLLENLASVNNPIMEAGEFTFDEFCKGFRNWREATTTSPHGNHLGCYKALLKYVPSSVKKRRQQEKQQAEKTKEPMPTTPVDLQLRPSQIPGQPPSAGPRNSATDTEKPLPDSSSSDIHQPSAELTGEDVMVVFYRLLVLAVRHGHVYDRWKTIHNFLLEKEPGNPKIHRLRFIHLYDAGYNFLLKLCLAKKLGSHVETHNTHVDEQGGGRAGRSAIDGAAKKAILFELIRLQHKQAINGDLDAVACFDRIVESISNMACSRQGCSTNLLKLHSKVMRTVRYHLRHKFGVSSRSNGHSDRHPFHGSGQGAGDSPIRWGLISASMIAAFNSQAARWEIYLPDGTVHFRTCIDAFVDDTTMILALHDECSLQTLLTSFQRNIDLWTGLLRATGGANNIKKSCVSLFLWGFDKHGRAFLRDPNSEPREISLPGISDISILDPDSGQRLPLRLTTPSQATKLLGVHLTQDGNSKKQTQVLSSKCNLYAQVVTASPFDRTDAHTLYSTVYCPAVSYPLPATHVPTSALRQIERPAVNAFLPKMGYNRHMPRAVVFAPQSSLGCGLRSLAHEQGVQQAMLLIRHLRANSTLGHTLRASIRTYQLVAGTRDPVLMDTRRICYMERESKWLTTLRQFLTTAHAQIEIDTPWNVPLLRANDEYIMELLLDEQRYSKLTLEILNTVRTFLRVTTLSDIVDHTGLRICPQALSVEINSANRPTFDTLRQSTFPHWPSRHQAPPRSSLRLWATVLRETLLSSTNTLHVPLGKWLPDALNPTSGRRWRFLASASLRNPAVPSSTMQVLRDCPLTDDDPTPVYHPIERNTRRFHVFSPSPLPTTPEDITIDKPLVPVFPDDAHLHLVPWCLSSSTSPVSPLPASHQSPNPSVDSVPQASTPEGFYSFVQTLPEWEQQWFFGTPVHIRQTLPGEPTLAELIQRDETLQICSDAATNTTKHSMYWVIVHKHTIMAEGGGIIPGDIQLANSGRSETVGTIAALRFLYQFSRYSAITPPSDVRWNSHCDNSGVISTIKWMREATRLYPGDHVMTDYDVRATLLATVNALATEGLQFFHIKGHQDDNINAPDLLRDIRNGIFHTAQSLEAQGIQLSLPAQMNIYCDHRATLLLRYWLEDGTDLTKPHPLPFEGVHLYIDNIPVFNDLPQALREAAARDDYHQHLAHILQVSVNSVADIDWTALRYASSRFTQPDQTRIQKYFHGWLPTTAFLSKMKLSSTDRCPTCGTCRETKEHLLYCDNIRREPLWKQFSHDLKEYFIATKTDRPLADLLLSGLTFGDRLTRQETTYAPNLQAAHDYQDQLGWSQLIYGRFVYEWGHSYEEGFTRRRQAPPSEGWMWVAGIIELCWKFVLTLWTDRNHDLHGLETAQQQLALTNSLHLRVRAQYAESPNIPAHSRHIYPMPQSEMLRQSPSQIKKWLHLAVPFIKAEKAAMATMEKYTTHDIRNYFPSLRDQPAATNPFLPTAGNLPQQS